MLVKKINTESLLSHAYSFPAITREEWQVNQALHELGLSRDIVRRIAHAAAGARNDATPLDPSFSPGMLSYIHGVRETRLALLPLGWEKSLDGNVELTVNRAKGIQICFQNVDLACAITDPEAVSSKGAASRRLVNSGQGEFDFTGGELSPMAFMVSSPTMWFICVSADEYSVRAEVSCPRGFEGNAFQGFWHRLLVVDESRSPEPRGRDIHGDDDIELDIQVTKKQ